VKTFTDQTSFIIKDLETLKVIADPLRFQVLDLLVIEPLTVKQLAEKLGLAPSKLYYHVNMLEEHGLIQVADTRVVSGIIEKTYRASSPGIDIDPSLLTFTTTTGRENVNALLVSTIDATREDLLRSLQARAFALDQGAAEQPRQIVINRALSRLSEERAQEFAKRLHDLLDEFGELDEVDSDHQKFALTVAYYPAFYYAEPAPGAEEETSHG
jgi:DNA-binding transcriptional ArsR family regulator